MKIKVNCKNVNEHNRCHYKRVYTKHNNYHWEVKHSYNSFHDAQLVCTKQNIYSVIEFKLIPYKCKVCGEIHIGKNVTVLNDLNDLILNKVKEYELQCM
jgi:hypothetical protein